MMRKFTVYRKITDYITVTAKSVKDAERLALEITESNWTLSDSEVWVRRHRTEDSLKVENSDG